MQLFLVDVQEQQKFIKFFDQMMKDTKNSIPLHYIKMHYIGSSGIGKSTTKNRLTGMITNVASLPVEERKHRSTHLAECTQVMAVMDENESKLTLKVSGNHDDETRMLVAYAFSSKSAEPDDASSLPESSTEYREHPVAEADETITVISTKEPDVRITVPAPEENGKKSEESAQVMVTVVEVDKVIARLRSIVGSGKYTEQLQNKILLNLIDVGGQPGFLEMFPFLSKGPGMFLVFFRLDKDLDEPCEVSYERDGDKITPYKAIYTIRETLSQILFSIKHHVTFDTAIDRELLNKLGDLASVEPVVTLVGTFKDKLEAQVKTAALHKKLSAKFPKASESEKGEVIKNALASSTADQTSDQPTTKVNPDMLSTVSQLVVSDSFKKEVEDCLRQELSEKNKAISTITCHFKDLLFHPAEDQQFIALDNYTGTETDLDPLREHLQKMFDNFFKGVKLRIRPPQLLLGVILRKEYDIVSMDDCIQIGRALNMDEEEVRFSMWYLDRWVGALIYHPEIEDDDDWFKKNIICSPQVIFNSISSLIVETLLEFHRPDGSTRGLGFKPAEKENWIEKGQFSLETVKRCLSKESKKLVEEGKLIPVDMLVKFLECSNLLSQITTKKKLGMRETTEVMCFIPAILECASPEELTKSPPPDADTPSPIKITFETGYVPIGVFCALISRLVSRGSEGILGMKWELVESGVKRNLVSFRVSSSKHEVTLVAHVNCYEIRIKPRHEDIDIHDLCSYILSSVLFVIKQICKLINPIIAFDCHCGQHEMREDDHSSGLCYIRGEEDGCIFFECDHSGSVTLVKSQEFWLIKVTY